MTLMTKAVAAAREGRLAAAARNRLAAFRRQRTDDAMRRAFGLKRATALVITGDFAKTASAAVLKKAFDTTRIEPSPLPAHIREIEGMSGQGYRAFINRLAGSMPKARYLEIGSWKGSTLCAALHGNTANAVCIDNWSEFNGPREEFFINISPIRDRIEVIEQDFRQIDYTSLGSFQIYLFDGPHREQDHRDAVVLAQAALAPDPIFIVDDWNLIDVRLGTLRGLAEAGFGLEAAIEIRTTLDNTNANVIGKTSDWHNGYLFAVLKREAGREPGTARIESGRSPSPRFAQRKSYPGCPRAARYD